MKSFTKSQALQRPWVRFLAISALVALSLVLVASIAIAIRLRDGSVKRRITTALSERWNAEVTLDSLSVRLLPTVRITAEGLTIRRRKDPAGFPPIIVASAFVVEPGLINVLQGHARRVEVEGLKFTIPRRGDHDPPPPPQPAPPPETTAAQEKSPLPEALPDIDPREIFIQELRATNAELIYISKDPNGPTRVFSIHDLEVLDAGFDRPMGYTARLTNPLPHGEMQMKGMFGPFNADEPAQTTIEGSYTLVDADFNTLKGLAGAVTSQGSFAGVIDQLDVNGSSDSKNFQLDAGGHAMPLSTTFRAIVDATSGDVEIKHLEGLLGESALTATGAITRVEGEPGRQVDLSVEFPDARLEDLLKAAVDASRPLMSGEVSLKAHVLLPTGEGRAIDRMSVSGTIGIDDAQFSDRAMQAKVRNASRKARGLKASVAPERALMDLTGRFTLKEGVARFQSLTFRTTGARVSVAGTYAFRSGALDFTGTARTEASVSKMVGGVKGFFLKLVDPIFRKDGAGAVLPIKISGTHGDPKVGVQIGRIFKGKNP